MIDQDRLVNRFLHLLNIDSPSKHERKLGEYLQQEVNKLGFEVTVDSAGERFGGDTGNLICRKKGNDPSLPTLLLSAHMDTVVSNKGVKVIIEDGVIKTDGQTILGADDKAGIAILLEALTIMKERNLCDRSLEVVFTVGEELGLLGSRYLNYELLEAKTGFVLDSGNDVGIIINQAPGQEDFYIEIMGKAAHSGVSPEAGINAIQMTGDFLSWFPYGKIDHETTGNIGLIKGGEAVNIVPAKVELTGEVRSRDDKKVDQIVKDIDTKLTAIAGKFGGKCSFKSERQYSAFNLTEDTTAVKLILKALKKIGLEGCLMSRGGGSDANNFNYNGIQTLNLAIGLTKGHTNEEEIKIGNLLQATRMILALVEDSND